MRVFNKGNVIKFQYSGDLCDAIKKAEKELERKKNSPDRDFLQWQKQRAVKAADSYEQRISDLEEFIRLGKEKNSGKGV